MPSFVPTFHLITQAYWIYACAFSPDQGSDLKAGADAWQLLCGPSLVLSLPPFSSCISSLTYAVSLNISVGHCAVTQCSTVSSLMSFPPFMSSFPMRMSAGQHLEPWASFVELSIKYGRRIPPRPTTRVKGFFPHTTNIFFMQYVALSFSRAY